ncbi:putative disease resistance protein RGA1 [Spinacia oleracea]|uniref:Disease resistance protein RGA1 n=1 Tax=Spinacia oleracea TaxID=3562 RepID=A0ABM3QTG1_SPIOL|nr:putative disease resistance protein RGA1 [Spinacia oleracea]
MAEGFIIPLNHGDQSLEELAEECFLILLQRCFFQDIKRDEWGDISSCKMHDLMHDLAIKVAGVNCKVAKFGESNSNTGIHHVSFAYRLTSSSKIPSWMLNLKLLRTFLLPEQRKDGSPLSKLISQEIISNFGCLRVLDLHNLGVRNLPSSIDLARWEGAYEDVSCSNHDEAVMEGLKPHPNLRQLGIYWYRGQKLPSWAMMGNLCINLPNLVEIELLRCGRCQQLPPFGQLPFLKCLSLVSLESVEYMEMDCSVYDHPLSSAEIPFFPSLQELTLMYMDNLKGWWNEAIVNNEAEEAAHISMSFSNLRKLWIQKCLKLIFLPKCPNVEELTLVDANERISLSKMATVTSSNSSSKLRKLTISNVEDLISLPRECLHQLHSLNVEGAELVNTDEIGNEVFKSISSSLCCLEFTHCNSLRFFAQGLEYLTAIEKLKLWDCKQLDLLPDEQLPWKNFKSLRSLGLHHFPRLLVLPSGLQHLVNLRSLEITCNDELREIPEWISCFSSLGYMRLFSCPKLTSLPEGFRKLTTLNQLFIKECPGLTEKCRRPNGSEWPKIQHIPLVTVLKDIHD